MSTLLNRITWDDTPACAGMVTRDWDPWTPPEDLTPDERGFQFHLARRVCAGCPIRTQCATTELTELEKHTPESMRGGLTPKELRALARSLGLPSQRRSQCGERSKYVSGCRCSACREAHATYEHQRRVQHGVAGAGMSGTAGLRV